jgi:lipid-binding SYLF domain-containing protein
MKPLSLFSSALLLAGLVVPGRAGEDHDKLRTDVEAAIASFEKSDSGMKTLLRNAAGYAVFPNVGKGGLVLGGAHGNGLVFEAGNLVGRASLSQLTLGAQVGGQAFAELILFETPATLAKFKESGFAMNAQIGAVAAAEGASKNARYVEGVMVFTKAKQGLMAEATVGGQKFKFEPIEKE